MWSVGQAGQLKSEKLLAWMKSPKPEALIRYFSYWNIADVFNAITHRAAQLTTFVEDEGWMWSVGQAGQLKSEKLLAWMKSPKPEALIRYFSYWNIADVFNAITNKAAKRERLWLLVKELVDKRNNIAHGDTGAAATTLDVRRYMKTVKTFCTRSDRVLAQAIARQCQVERPW